MSSVIVLHNEMKQLLLNFMDNKKEHTTEAAYQGLMLEVDGYESEELEREIVSMTEKSTPNKCPTICLTATTSHPLSNRSENAFNSMSVIEQQTAFAINNDTSSLASENSWSSLTSSELKAEGAFVENETDTDDRTPTAAEIIVNSECCTKNHDTNKSSSPKSHHQAEIVKVLREEGTSDDDLLNELDEVVATEAESEDSGNETVILGHETLVSKNDVTTVADESLSSMKKKLEAVQRRLEYTIQERKHLELENINLERKVEAIVRSHALESKELLESMEVQKNELEEVKVKLIHQLETSKQETQQILEVHKSEIDQMKRKLEECKREKEEAVVRYARAEQKFMEVTDKLQKSEVKMKEWSKERETALNRWKTMKSENKRAFDICEVQKTEIAQLKKDNERLKESESSSEMKVKWHQNKLKSEQDSHKETSSKLSEATKTLSDLKMESVFIFDTVRSIYTALQDLYSGQSSQQAPPPPPPPKPDMNNITLIIPAVKKDLQTLLWKQKEIVAEMKTYRDKIHCLELERLSQQDELVSTRGSLETQQQGNEDLKERLSRLQDLEEDYDRLSSELRSTRERLKEFGMLNEELSAELSACKRRETDNMEFGGKLSQVNSELKALSDALTLELTNKTVLCDSLQERVSLLDEQVANLTSERKQSIDESSKIIEGLTRELEDCHKLIEELNVKKQEMEDEMKTASRKHAAIVKDLRRHVLSGRRPQTTDDTKISQETGSLCSSRSHGGSSLSLDMASGYQVAPAHLHHSPQTTASTGPSRLQEAPSNSGVTNEEVEAEIAFLVQHLKKKTSKIAFLKDHVDQLTEELHRKSKIIRDYALREETGSMAPEASDMNKAQLTRKGGIMASLYGSNAHDSGMTLGLSMEINRKLQALVEDALLKNIKFKESMDMLGQEIDWLTKENKSLRAQLNETKDAVFSQGNDLHSSTITTANNVIKSESDSELAQNS